MEKDCFSRRTRVLFDHLSNIHPQKDGNTSVILAPCLQYLPPEIHADKRIDPALLREMLDMDGVNILDETFRVFKRNKLFWNGDSDNEGNVFTSMDYNTTKEEQRDITFKRILFLRDLGYFRGFLTSDDPNILRQKGVMHEAIGMYDHSMGVKLGVHIQLWGGAIKYLGTKRHHDKWLKKSEDYEVAGCFALTELGHGSNVRGIETVATYDSKTEEFIINTPCESAQKYWIGGAAQHATHTVAFAQLYMNGKNEGVHAFIVQIRDGSGRTTRGIRIADCGHKIGLNGVDNGRIWFDKVRIPRENLLNAVADVTPDGTYQSSIREPEQRFAAFMAPLTLGRVTIAVSAVNQCKIGLSIALRYALSRRAFSLAPGQPEVLLLDYPSHQHRLLPLLAKTFALNFACNELKELYLHRTASDTKVIHVQSSGYKAMASWHMLRTLQECREACGGQGIRSDNRIGQLKAEHDVMATFEGDNNVLMQTVSKALLADYFTAKKKNNPMAGMGMEHVNGPPPVLPKDVRSIEFQESLFKLRERDLLEKFAAEISQRLSTGQALTSAMNESFQVATDLGRAHAEREVQAAINSAVKRADVEDIKEVLTLLSSLYSLVLVDEDPVFLRQGYLDVAQAQAIHEEVVHLCKKIRPYTLNLVESFGIPQHLLGPIAFDWVKSNSWHNVSNGSFLLSNDSAQL